MPIDRLPGLELKKLIITVSYKSKGGKCELGSGTVSSRYFGSPRNIVRVPQASGLDNSKGKPCTRNKRPIREHSNMLIELKNGIGVDWGVLMESGLIPIFRD